jgi:hypothetical protein
MAQILSILALSTRAIKERILRRARNLEMTHCDIHADVNVIKEGTRNVSDNVKVTKGGAFIISISSYTY